jgi:hypothetical protein
MSNPIAAGAATVVRDFYQKAYGHAASAALVKATLINSAVDLLDENNDGANDNDFPIPNVHEGWGRVNLVGATAITQFIDNAAGVGTSGVASNQYAVNGGSPFKVSLVWTDYPSSETAAQNLVNDLDLTVTSPTGAVYRGNVFSGGWSQTGGSADRVNNVENVFVQAATGGNWTVEVRGFNVANGPQPFALVVSGAGTSTPDNRPTVLLTTPASGATVSGSVNVTAAASDDKGVTQVEFLVDGASIGVDTTAPYEATWNTTAVGNGGHTLTARATDTANQTTTSAAVSVTVANVVPDNPPTVSLTAPANGATVAGAVNVAATASDDKGVTQVEFFVDTVSIGVDTSASFGVIWNTTSVANGSHTITVRATDTANQTTTSASIDVTVNNVAGNVLYVSSTSGGTVGGVAFSDEDILRFDPATGTWTLFFDGSDVGLGSSNNQDIDAFDILADGSILLSTVDATTLPNVGSIDDSDIVRFAPTSLGSTTAGTFAWYFDGSDVGLSTNNEDVDAVDLLADGRLLVSTLGSYSVSGASGGDTDLIAFAPIATGANTSGNWALYFDGSDVGLADSSTEDVGGAWVNEANGDIYLAAVGAFSVVGAAGDGADVFICRPSSLGNNTACTFGPGLYWDGSANGFAGQVVDGVALTAASVGSGVRQLDGTLTPEDVANQNTFDDAEDEIEANDEAPDETDVNRLFLPVIVR